jgi:hypothetical protein
VKLTHALVENQPNEDEDEMPKENKPLTFEEMLVMSRGGTRESVYQDYAPSTRKKHNPTKDLSVFGAIDNIRSGGRK